MLKRDIGAIWSKGEKTMLKNLTAFLTAAVMVTSVASIPVLTSYADTNSTTEKRVMEKLDRGTVAVKTNTMQLAIPIQKVRRITSIQLCRKVRQ